MVQTTRPLAIAVIGGGSPPPEALELAHQVGRELARRGAVVVTGGLGGVMEAACRGAKEAGGLTVGIIPGSDPASANPYVDIVIGTDMSFARNVIVVKSGRAVIAVDGAYGTLSEIAHALGEGIPVVGLGTWSFGVNGRLDRAIIQAADPVDAVEKAIAAARRRDEAPAARVRAPGLAQ
ncbi:MAG: TIGR00725 family protein [Chloroflexi bacterium]|nr:TIGR00725 family protein [Chloroflexota bacterium]